MTREEAARLLEYHLKNEPTYIGLDDALRMAIAALRGQGWVRTSERLPTLKDAPNGRVVNAWSYAPMSGEYGLMVGNLEDVEATANPKDYWMPLPPLPEVDA